MEPRDTREIRSGLPRWRRALRAARLVAALVVVFGPIADAAWNLSDVVSGESRFREVLPPDRGPGPTVQPASDSAAASAQSRALSERVAEYRRIRSAAVDHLLPDGRGGTRFYEDLDGAAGMAFYKTQTVGLSASVALDVQPEGVELHERAHLIHSRMPREVARLMMRLPAPTAAVAIESAEQHFAEMAAEAWALVAAFVAPPQNACVLPSTTDDLRAAEVRVPGTAGFLVRYLSLLRATSSLPPDLAGLDAPAQQLSAPYRAELDAIWRRIDSLRRADGTFEPWPAPTIRGRLQDDYDRLRSSRSWFDRIAGVTLLPSLLLVSIAGA